MKKTYTYALTLTASDERTRDEIRQRGMYICNLPWIYSFRISEEDTKRGQLHLHATLTSHVPMPSQSPYRRIIKILNIDFVKMDLLRTDADISRWDTYINKHQTSLEEIDRATDKYTLKGCPWASAASEAGCLLHICTI